MPRIRVVRLAAALAGLAGLLTACSQSAPRSFPPLRYGYLTPLPLNVQSIDVDSRFVPAGEESVNDLDPAPPVQVLTDMAHDRLQAAGGAGRAVFVIKDASIVRDGDTLTGNMDVELDVYSGGDTRAGFAEARVTRTRTGDLDDIQTALYDMTSQMMDAMNIEFEFQVRRSLRDWLLAPGATQGPVSQQPLAPPPGTPLAAPSAPATSLAPPTTMSPPPTTLAPPSATTVAPYGAPAPAYSTPAYSTPAYPAPAYATPPTYPTQAYPSPSYPTPAYPTPTYPTPTYPTPAYPTPAYPTPAYPTPAYPAPADPGPASGLSQPVPLVPPTQP